MSLAEDEKGIPCESVTEAAAVFFRIDRKVYVFFATHCHWIFWEDVAKKEISQKTCRLIRIYACGTSGSNQIRLIFYLVSMTVISYAKGSETVDKQKNEYQIAQKMLLSQVIFNRKILITLQGIELLALLFLHSKPLLCLNQKDTLIDSLFKKTQNDPFNFNLFYKQF